MFIVGFVIFSLYMYVMIWSIFYNSKKQREENYPNLTGMGTPISSRSIGSVSPKRKKRNIKRNKAV